MESFNSNDYQIGESQEFKPKEKTYNEQMETSSLTCFNDPTKLTLKELRKRNNLTREKENELNNKINLMINNPKIDYLKVLEFNQTGGLYVKYLYCGKIYFILFEMLVFDKQPMLCVVASKEMDKYDLDDYDSDEDTLSSKKYGKFAILKPKIDNTGHKTLTLDMYFDFVIESLERKIGKFDYIHI